MESFGILARNALPVLTLHCKPPVTILDNQSLFQKMNCELWEIIENYYFIVASEDYLNFQKVTLHSRSTAAIDTILAPRVREPRCRKC